MAERVALLVRIKPSLKAHLVELARREHRSLNQQIEFLLENAISRGMADVANEPEKRPKHKGP
jgi:hypothetical protein